MAVAVPGYDFEIWWGLLAPAATPPEIVNKLNGAINQILAKPAIRANFVKEGAIPAPLTPSQFSAVIAGDIERWKKLAQQRNIVAD